VTGQLMMVPDAISRWMGVATSFALSRGYTFDPHCLKDLFDFLSGGAASMPESTSGDTLGTYDAAVENLVAAMIENLNIQDPLGSVLHEWTLSNAKLRVCPLFPFC
jgi:hypothetical protein